jgi:hypothetical protein
VSTEAPRWRMNGLFQILGKLQWNMPSIGTSCKPTLLRVWTLVTSHHLG